MSVGKNSIRRITAAANNEPVKSAEAEANAAVAAPQAAKRTVKRSTAPQKAAKATAAPAAAVRLGQPLPYWLL